MLKTVKSSTAVLFLSTLVTVPAGEAQSEELQSDHEAIIQAAYDYAYGVASHDWDRVKRAFALDKAQMKVRYEKDGAQKVFVVPIRDLLEKVWKSLPESADHHVEVLDLNIVGDTYATVAINNNDQFLDHLSLYKLDGHWKIVDKLAIRHPEAEPMTIDWDSIFGVQD